MVAAGRIESQLPVEPNPELAASVVRLELRAASNPILTSAPGLPVPLAA